MLYFNPRRAHELEQERLRRISEVRQQKFKATSARKSTASAIPNSLLRTPFAKQVHSSSSVSQLKSRNPLLPTQISTRVSDNPHPISFLQQDPTKESIASSKSLLQPYSEQVDEPKSSKASKSSNASKHCMAPGKTPDLDEPKIINETQYREKPFTETEIAKEHTKSTLDSTRHPRSVTKSVEYPSTRRFFRMNSRTPPFILKPTANSVMTVHLIDSSGGVHRSSRSESGEHFEPYKHIFREIPVRDRYQVFSEKKARMAQYYKRVQSSFKPRSDLNKMMEVEKSSVKYQQRRANSIRKINIFD